MFLVLMAWGQVALVLMAWGPGALPPVAWEQVASRTWVFLPLADRHPHH